MTATRVMIPRAAVTLALTLVLVVLWLLTHRYKGLTGDAEVYAFQALAKIHPELGRDLYLQNVSQDQFTIFSPFYAWCIGLLGMQGAVMTLTILFKVWFFAAAWWVVRDLWNRDMAFFALGFIIVTTGSYGAAGVFQYLEDWLTARSLGEALVVSGLALYFRDLKLAGLLVAVAAMLVHPLMAFPGVLLILCLWLPVRMGVAGAAAGIVACLCLSLAAAQIPNVARVVTVMDPTWLEVVRERSQFLFLQLWSVDDWKINARPFLSLAMSSLVLNEPRGRKLCLSALIVGATGLAVAFIAGSIGPVAVLLQGQAWRWVWVTMFISILLLAPTLARLWTDRRCGPLCAMLLFCGWTLTWIDPLLCTALALGLWLGRAHVPDRMTPYLRGTAVAMGAVIVMWIIANAWTIASAARPEVGRENVVLSSVRNVLGLEALAVPLLWLTAYRVRSIQSAAGVTFTTIALAVLAVWLTPGTFGSIGIRTGPLASPGEFAEWRGVIPPGSNVLVIPTPNSAAIAWLSLERPSYLSLDQSAGVVYSRQTALEVRRRTEVVVPLWDRNWQILSRNRAKHSDVTNSGAKSARPLTQDGLVALCGDPQLDFVVAKENVGFDALTHTRNGSWKNWNLYDCRRVKSQPPAA